MMEKLKDKPRIRVLIPVWGGEYIAFFLKYCVPSLLASGNFPLLAQECDFGITFLTKQASVPLFKSFGSFSKLEELCHIEYECIDDLLIGNPSYAVPLTLGYLRGMTRENDMMTETFFLCINSDFLMAEGSCKKILEYIKEDKSAIFAPSFRVDKKKALSFYDATLEENGGAISVPPRRMVEQALNHPHPTVSMRTVNQENFSSIHTDQMYWRIDRNTVIARFFLSMQLCIKPEKQISEISGFFDYSLLQTLCPSGNYAYITDSDDFFMVELQDRKTEREFFSFVPPSKKRIAKRLQEWATALHYENATHLLVFHSNELPPKFENERKSFNDYYEKMLSYIKKPPIPHDNHPYWHSALNGFLFARRNASRPSLLQKINILNEIINRELESSSSDNFARPDGGNDIAINVQIPPLPSKTDNKLIKSGIKMIPHMPSPLFFISVYQRIWALFTLLYGTYPYVYAWHPQWLEKHFVCKKLRRAINYKNTIQILYVSDMNDYDALFLKSNFSIEKVLPTELSMLDKNHMFDLCFVHISGVAIADTQIILKDAILRLSQGGKLFALIGQELKSTNDFLSLQYLYLDTCVGSLLDRKYEVIKLGRSISNFILMIYQNSSSFCASYPLLSILLFLFLAPLTLFSNIISHLRTLTRARHSNFIALWIESTK